MDSFSRQSVLQSLGNQSSLFSCHQKIYLLNQSSKTITVAFFPLLVRMVSRGLPSLQVTFLLVNLQNDFVKSEPITRVDGEVGWKASSLVFTLLKVLMQPVSSLRQCLGNGLLVG